MPWGRTEVEMCAQRVEPRGERAEILLFQSKVKIGPRRLWPGAEEAIKPTLDATGIQLTQYVKDLHMFAA